MTGNNTGGMPSSLGVQGGHEDGPPHFIDNEDPKRTVSVTARAIGFMQEQHRSGHPFYVQISYYAQHLSVVTTEKMLAKYMAKGKPDRAYTHAWAAMLEELDNGVGRLLDALRELSIEDVDRNVTRMLNYIVKTPRFKGYEYSNKPDLKAHAAVTRQSATEGMVLLKNNNMKPVTTGLSTLQGQFITSWNVLVAGSLLATIPTVIVFIFLQRYFIEGLTMGSGK